MALRRVAPSRSLGSATFSHADNVGMRLKNWKMKPTLVRRNAARSFSDIALIASPSNRIIPESGTSSAPSMFNSVLFPDPEGPMIAVNSPRSTLRLTSSSARTVCPPTG